MLNGDWTRFKALGDDPTARRRILRDRGAIVYPGPDEPPAEAWSKNLDNWPEFEARAKRLGFAPKPFPLELIPRPDKEPPNETSAQTGTGSTAIPIRKDLLGGFNDGHWDQWTVSGTAFTGVPKRGAVGGQISIRGEWKGGLINTFDPELGDAATGEAKSPVFTSAPGRRLEFGVGGGKSKNVGVSLLVEGRVVQTWSGTDQEALERVSVDMTPYADKKLQIRVFDFETDGWGHILPDEFTLRSARLHRPWLSRLKWIGRRIALTTHRRN
jgi:hypothetical protein